ncbi:MAG: hydrogen gas-evolving membrane-bound hydrogenase subunit E [Candidatus Fermentibacteria bacterium]
MIELYVLLGLMIAGAVIAIEVKNLLSAVITVGIIGLALSIIFILLKAPDVALTQIVVEIVAVIMLIRATLNREIAQKSCGSRPFGAFMGILFLGLAVIAAIVTFSSGLAPFGEPLMTVSRFYPLNAVTGTGAVNVVSSIILDYRAYDTLGEATVLFTAVIGVMTVMRSVGKKKEEDLQENNE